MQDAKRIISKLSNQLKKGQKEPNFFYLLRLIENCKQDLPKIGFAKSPDEEPLRLGQMPYLKFPSTSIASITETSANKNEELLVLVYFFGLLGVNGPLPLDITSYIYQRSIHQYDASPRRFLDIINHRLLTLFYRAFSHNEIAVDFDRNNDEIKNIFKSLTGSFNRKASVLSPYFLSSMCRFLSFRARSADGLYQCLKMFFNVPLKLNTFKETTNTIPKELRLVLGQEDNSKLGVNTQLGRRFFSNTKSISIEIGPISFEESFKFMPNQVMFCALCEIVKQYLSRPLRLFLTIIIKGDSIECARLNGGFALGQSVHLISNYKDRKEKRVNINVSSLEGITVH